MASTTSSRVASAAETWIRRSIARDRDLLLAEVERNPDDERSVFYLAQSYFNLGDFANAASGF